MPENFFTTTARKVSTIEKTQRESVAENGYSMGDIIGSYLALPQLRGFWPMSSVDETLKVLDISGQGRILSFNAGYAYSLYNNIVPYVFLDGISQYLFRASEAGTSITGALTFGTWVFFAANTAINFFGKLGAAGQYGYTNSYSGGFLNAFVSSNGTLGPSVTSSIASPLNTFHFVATRYTPSTELAIFVDGVKTVNTTAIPAAIFASNAQFQVGASTANAQFLNGAMALPFLCAYAVPDAVIKRIYNLSRTMFGV
jgi:hypothetical protein